MHQNFFPYLLSILLLIAMIAYSVTVEVIEDGTPEKEDLAKALARSKRFFWRTMMEEWDCHKVEIKPDEIGITDKDELRQICESWKVKALAANAFLKSWEKHEGASSSSSSANIPNDQIKVEKPLFRLVDGRELQLSSAMEAIKAAYRVLFGWRKAEGFNTEFDFVNVFKFLHKNGPIISPKDSKLNQSEFEEEMENGKKMNYLKEYYKKNINLRKGVVHLLDVINKKNERQKKKQKKQKGTFNETLIDKPNAIRSNGTRFLEYWDSVLELGLDMEMICKEVKNYANEHKGNPNAYKQFLDEILWTVGTNKTKLISIIRRRLPTNSEEMIKERYVGKTFFIYKRLIRDPILNKNLDMELKPLQDPCEEAKLKVKKIEGSYHWCDQ